MTTSRPYTIWNRQTPLIPVTDETAGQGVALERAQEAATQATGGRRLRRQHHLPDHWRAHSASCGPGAALMPLWIPPAILNHLDHHPGGYNSS